MKMRRKVLASMLFAFLPWLAMAQSTDDLYFIRGESEGWSGT